MIDPAELLPALPWLLPFAALLRLMRKEPDLSQAPLASGRLVSVIIPARNEATTIANVLSSVLATTYDPVEVIVVDDRSSDDTAGVVGALAASDARLRLVRGAELEAGWYGKPWACAQGYREARGELLCFTDADTTHHPELLSRAVGAMEQQSAALVTVSPFQRTVSFWERAIMPQIWAMLGFRYHPAAVNRATRPRDVIANGQFILVRRDAYEAVGTHAAVRHEVAEDLALAQAFLRNGHRIWFAFAETLMETRMYTGLRPLVEGWSKNIYLGGRRSFPDEPILRALVPASLIVAMLFWLVPPVALVLAWLGLVDSYVVEPMTLAVALSVLFWAVMVSGMRLSAVNAVLYPLGAAMTLYIVLRSASRGARRVE
ncbi:MAG: glycosyltransferase, partial [Gemmatimonadota bacterium]|nr:glycosyltransferase [Gemmatimonadota bacterium]